MPTWQITFETGATRTIKENDLFAARRKVLSGIGAHRLPKIIGIALVEDVDREVIRAKAARLFT